MGQLVDRSKRMRLQLAVEVRGQDQGGATFVENTRTLNVSAGGILFESHRKVPMGARLELGIEVPPPLRRHFGGSQRYQTLAAVCRVERLEGEAGFRIGARFLQGPVR